MIGAQRPAAVDPDQTKCGCATLMLHQSPMLAGSTCAAAFCPLRHRAPASSPHIGGRTCYTGTLLIALEGTLFNDLARDLLLNRIGLFGHRARQPAKLVARLVKLIDQGQNDWQAHVL